MEKTMSDIVKSNRKPGRPPKDPEANEERKRMLLEAKSKFKRQRGRPRKEAKGRGRPPKVAKDEREREEKRPQKTKSGLSKKKYLDTVRSVNTNDSENSDE